MSSLPKISIVMPVLNREDTIEKAIRSVIEQQYENYEFLIFDGGSTDGTVEIIQRYASYLAYWHSKKDGSCVLAYNEAITKATGDVVVILMADDFFEKDTFKHVAMTMQQHPDADMYTVGGRIVSNSKKEDAYKVLRRFETAKDLKLSFYNICFAEPGICCRFIKKSFYEKTGLYYPKTQTGLHFFSNDKEYLLRAILYNAKDVFVNYRGHNYFSHKGSSTFGNNKKNLIQLCQEHMEIASSYLVEKPLTLQQRLLLVWWYNDQSARYLMFHLLEAEWRLSLGIAIDGLKKYNLLWLGVFFSTGLQLSLKRVYRFFRKLFPPMYAPKETTVKAI